MIEAVVLPDAVVQGSSPLSLDLRRRYGVNLIAAARQGRRFEGRLRDATLATGDVLLLEGEPARLSAAIAELGCLPLEQRRLVLQPRRVALPIALFACGIALAASGLLPAAVAFTAVVVAMVLHARGPPRPALREHRLAGDRAARRDDSARRCAPARPAPRS